MVCGGAHALHDGFTDLLNVLYPLLQAQFGLSYAAIGASENRLFRRHGERARSPRAGSPSALAACACWRWAPP